MTATVLSMPVDAMGYALAREILRRDDLTREQIEAACDVLGVSQDWTDIRLVREARNALFSDRYSELQGPARRMAQSLTDMNRPQIDRDRRADAWRYAARACLGVTAAAGLALIASSLWADTTARVSATLDTARCGEVCIFAMEE